LLIQTPDKKMPANALIFSFQDLKGLPMALNEKMGVVVAPEQNFKVKLPLSPECWSHYMPEWGEPCAVVSDAGVFLRSRWGNHESVVAWVDASTGNVEFQEPGSRKLDALSYEIMFQRNERTEDVVLRFDRPKKADR